MIITFSDASFNITARTSYGQGGVISGVRICEEGHMDVYHMINWLSINQRGVCHSSYRAQILACAEGDDMGLCIQTALRSHFKTVYIRN